MKSDNRLEDRMDLLVFMVGDRHFAVNSSEVVEISEVATVTPAPFTDHFVSGLVSVSGRILPQIHLGALLSDAPADENYAELIILSGGGTACAIAVDKVHEKLSLSAEDIASVESSESDEHGFVIGEFRWHEHAVIVLSATALSSLVLSGDMQDGDNAFLATANDEEDQGGGENRQNFLKLVIGKEAYALPMDQALEIVEASDYSPVPGAPGFIRGLSLVREQSLLVASAACLLGLGEVQENVIVVMPVGEMRAGISVTAVETVVTATEDRIHRFSDTENRLAGVIHQDDKTILGLLSARSLFSRNEESAMSAHTPRHRHVEGRERVVITRSVLEVEQGHQHFGIPVGSIERIIDYQPPRPVPTDNRLISGAIEYESRVLPVLSGELLCPLDENHRHGAFVIVSDDRQRQWALPVEQATRIRDIDEAVIKPLEQREGSMVREVAQFQGRLLSMVNLTALAELESPDVNQEPAP